MSQSFRISNLTLSLLAAAALAACGGGGGADTAATAQGASATNSDMSQAEGAKPTATPATPTAAATTTSAASLVAAMGTTTSVTQVVATASAAPDASWVKVANEGQPIVMSASQAVRYGAGSSWVQATVPATGGACSNTFFGIDPIKYTSKQCYTTTTATTTGTSSSTTTSAPGYYVDAVAGNDAGTGASDQPWKTLAKLASARLKPGDGIYLNCGSTWRETLTLTSTQLVDGSIVTGYGSACSTSKPKISGADNFSSGWTKSGNIWSRAVPTTTPKILRLFINGSTQRTAQWPNYGGVGHEYAIADSASPSSMNTLTVNSTDAAALAGQDITGALLQVRSDPWYVNQATVGSYNTSSHVLTLSTNATYTMEGGDGYVLQDKKWMLDAPGEFYHDTANGMLYVYPADSASQSNLNSALVEGSVRDNAVNIGGRAKLALSNFSATMARTDALVLNQATSPVVNNVEASHSGRSGVRVALGTLPALPARSATIQNSSIADNWLMGIDATAVANVSILSNSVTGTGTLGNAGASSSAIYAGDGAFVDRNTINGSGYHGIQFSGTGGSQVTNNVIQSYCQRLTDCAGIYAWNSATASAQRKTNQLSTVSGNRVLSATPNTQGAVGGGADIVAGVYLDAFMINVTIQNNMVTGMPLGIIVHDASNNVIANNSVWFTTKYGLWATMDITSGDYMTGNVFRGNQLIPATTVTGTWPALPQLGTSYAVTYQDVVSGSASLTSGSNLFTQNQIVQLNGVAGTVAYVLSASNSQLLTAAGWRSLNPGEAPLSVPASYSAYSTTLGPELMTGGGFDSGITPWQAWFWSGASGGSLQSVSGAQGCTGSCARFTAASAYDSFYSPGFSMTAGMPYALSFSASFGAAGTIARPNVSTNVSPYPSLMGSQGYVTLSSLSGSAGDIVNFQGLFIPTSTSQARVNFGMSTFGVPVNFDSVSVKAVTAYTWSKATDWSAVIYAPTDASRSVACSDLGWPNGCSVMDVNGNATPLPTTLPAGTNKLFLRVDSPWKQ